MTDEDDKGNGLPHGRQLVEYVLLPDVNGVDRTATGA